MIPREFYRRKTTKVAKDLLGKRLVRCMDKHVVSAIIVETEAYGHKDDPASHAATKMTERNKVMFGDVGMSYVYFTYGMHYCFNVVAKDRHSKAGAVLIRALKPDTKPAIDIMVKNRGITDVKRISDGPAKLTQAMKITRMHNGADLTQKNDIYITNGITHAGRIVASPRVGIKKATELMWNFKIHI